MPDNTRPIVPVFGCSNEDGEHVNPARIMDGFGYWREHSISTIGVVDKMSLNDKDFYTMEEVREALEFKCSRDEAVEECKELLSMVGMQPRRHPFVNLYSRLNKILYLIKGR